MAVRAVEAVLAADDGAPGGGGVQLRADCVLGRFYGRVGSLLSELFLKVTGNLVVQLIHMIGDRRPDSLPPIHGAVALDCFPDPSTRDQPRSVR